MRDVPDPSRRLRRGKRRPVSAGTRKTARLVAGSHPASSASSSPPSWTLTRRPSSRPSARIVVTTSPVTVHHAACRPAGGPVPGRPRVRRQAMMSAIWFEMSVSMIGSSSKRRARRITRKGGTSSTVRGFDGSTVRGSSATARSRVRRFEGASVRVEASVVHLRTSHRRTLEPLRSTEGALRPGARARCRRKVTTRRS